MRNQIIIGIKKKKIPLTRISGKKFVLIEESVDTFKLKKAINTPKAKFLKYNDLNYSQSIKSYKNQQQKIKKWAVLADIDIVDKKLTEDIRISYEAPFYLTKQNIEAGLSHLFYVKLNNQTELMEQIAEAVLILLILLFFPYILFMMIVLLW